MIISFKSKALKLYWWKGNPRRLPADQLPRITRLLQQLEDATSPQDMDQPGNHFHALTGQQAGRWSVRVTGNWRITFAFDKLDAEAIDYEDYH